jgi:hypothetical protein
MTLRELANEVTIQGAIRISVWGVPNEPDDKVIYQNRDSDGFSVLQLDEAVEEFADWEVSYMFVGGDRYMHIELCEEE